MDITQRVLDCLHSQNKVSVAAVGSHPVLIEMVTRVQIS